MLLLDPGVFFELYYSRAPVITTKVIALISILDDIYDVYSTLEESQQLTKVIQRFANLISMDRLPFTIMAQNMITKSATNNIA